MIDQLPRWVWVAGGALSFAAGLMNAVGLLAFGGEAVTHLTGTTTLIAGHVGFGRWDSALHLLGILAAFCAGAVFSGWLIRDQHLKLGRRYSVALWIEALLILAATQAFDGLFQRLLARAANDQFETADCHQCNFGHGSDIPIVFNIQNALFTHNHLCLFEPKL